MNKQESMTFTQIVYVLALFGASNGQLGTWINFEGRTYFVSDSEEYPYEAEIMCHVLNSSLVTQSENLDNFSRNLPSDKYYWIGQIIDVPTSGQCILMKTGMNKTTYYQEFCSLKLQFICVKNATLATLHPTISVYDSFVSSIYIESTTTGLSGKLILSSSLQILENNKSSDEHSSILPMTTPLLLTRSEELSLSVEPSVGQKLSTSLVQKPSRQASLFSVYSSPISTARTLSANATDMTGSSAVSMNIQVFSSMFGRHVLDVSSSITAETQLPNLISNIEIQSSVTSAISSSSGPKDHPIWSTFPEGYTQSWIYQPCTKYETAIMSSTIIVTTYVSSSSVRSSDATPNCSCFINSADSSIYNLEDILAELAVDSKNTAKYTRKHTSADDKRTSAKAVGYVGALVICSLIGALIILDGKSFCRGFGRIHIRERRNSDLHD